METNRIRQFRVVVETGNLRKAAEILHISHSGLSKSLKALEDEVGVRLFVPSGRGIVPSDAGRALFEKSARFLEEVQRFVGPGLARPQALRLGSFETFTSYFVGPLLKNYLPESEIEVHELVPGRLEVALVLEKIDFGITYEPVPRKGVEYVKVASLTMGAFALKGPLTNLDVTKVPFITPVTPLEGAPSGVKGRDGWPDERFERNVKFRVDLLGTGLELARQGLGAIFIPRFVAELHNQRTKTEFHLEALKLPRGLTAIKRDVFVIRRESTEENHALRQIAKALRDFCA